MKSPTVLNTEAIIELERGDLAALRAMSMQQRSALLQQACRAASKLEASRIASGFPPSKPAPWPESTWQFLKEQTVRARQQQL